jgi:hypothetical protein
MKACCFEVIADDTRELARVAKRRKGSKIHRLVHMLAVKVTAANEQEQRRQGRGRSKESALRWSSSRKTRRALCCCHAVGAAQLWLGGRSKRLARRYERLASTLPGMHWLVFASLMLIYLFGKS